MTNATVSLIRVGRKNYQQTFKLQSFFAEGLRKRHLQRTHPNLPSSHFEIANRNSKLGDFFKDKLRNEQWAGALILVEHDPGIYTMGKRDTSVDLLGEGGEILKEKNGYQVIKTSRGGAVTWHGPGQLVAYPIVDFSMLKKGEKSYGIASYIESLQGTIINTLSELNIKAGTTKDVGVWVDQSRKIAAIGISASNHVSMHGLAINVFNSLDPFDAIIPCGIRDKKVTSVSAELKRKVPLSEVEVPLIKSFSKNFSIQLSEESIPFSSLDELD
eukprot:TRINITY_DN50_c1_g1_i1.p1 TRINITY_DN50_c1_g1~~TRINITY_DN50_c1_g1_i1.p1  ORF type:complete len:272 (-),score=97.39 TRINITY_DN50_c1_g1_i1:779-1594(-)